MLQYSTSGSNSKDCWTFQLIDCQKVPMLYKETFLHPLAILFKTFILSSLSIYFHNHYPLPKLPANHLLKTYSMTRKYGAGSFWWKKLDYRIGLIELRLFSLC